MSLWSVLCFQRNLEFALVEGTHRCLVPRVTQVHKHHIPGLLLRSRKILFINSICQCNWKKKKIYTLSNQVKWCQHLSLWLNLDWNPAQHPVTDLLLSHSWASGSWGQQSEQHLPLISARHRCSSREPGSNRTAFLDFNNSASLIFVFSVPRLVIKQPIWWVFFLKVDSRENTYEGWARMSQNFPFSKNSTLTDTTQSNTGFFRALSAVSFSLVRSMAVICSMLNSFSSSI